MPGDWGTDGAGQQQRQDDRYLPEQMVRNGPDVWRVRVRGVPCQFEGIVSAGLLQDVELVQQGVGPDDFSPSSDEGVWEQGRSDECLLRIGHCFGIL